MNNLLKTVVGVALLSLSACAEGLIVCSDISEPEKKQRALAASEPFFSYLVSRDIVSKERLFHDFRTDVYECPNSQNMELKVALTPLLEPMGFVSEATLDGSTFAISHITVEGVNYEWPSDHPKGSH